MMLSFTCVDFYLQAVPKWHIEKWFKHAFINPYHRSIVFNGLSNPSKFLPQIRYEQLLTQLLQNDEKHSNLIKDSKTNSTGHFLKTFNDQLRSRVAFIVMV